MFGLTIQEEALLQIRQARLKHLGMPADTSYGQREHISQEIAYAQALFRQNPGWPVIDITGKAVEETAADILRIKKDREARKNEATRGEPTRVSICHCLACQKRTGSVFAAQARFPVDAVVVAGRSRQYVRTGDEGTSARFHFCP